MPLNFEGQAEDVSTDQILADVLKSVAKLDRPAGPAGAGKTGK